MVWVAFDSVIKGVEGTVSRARWRSGGAIRDEVREQILERGFNEERDSFMQHFDTTDVDAALLLIPVVGFLPGDDPKMLGTIKAVEKDLLHGGLLLRYRTQSGVDGIGGDEYPFLACSFWLVSAWPGRAPRRRRCPDAPAGRAHQRPRTALARSTTRCTERMVGNFPQAFSHLALVSAAMNLTRL